MNLGYTDYALQAVGHCARRVIVAGGCLRDAHIGIIPKDIDVFTGPDFDPEKVDGRFWEVVYSSKDRDDESYDGISEADDPRGIMAIYEVWGIGYHLEENPMIQVVALNRDPELFSLIRSFDIGACQIGMDACGLVGRTAGFYLDHEKKALSYCPVGVVRQDLDHSKDRASRISAHTKYNVDWSSFKSSEEEVEDVGVSFTFDAMEEAT